MAFTNQPVDKLADILYLREATMKKLLFLTGLILLNVTLALDLDRGKLSDQPAWVQSTVADINKQLDRYAMPGGIVGISIKDIQSGDSFSMAHLESSIDRGCEEIRDRCRGRRGWQSVRNDPDVAERRHRHEVQHHSGLRWRQ